MSCLQFFSVNFCIGFDICLPRHIKKNIHFRTLTAVHAHPALADSSNAVAFSSTDDEVTVASLLTASKLIPKPPSNQFHHTQPSPRHAVTQSATRPKRENDEIVKEKLPSLMSVSAGLQLIRSSEKMVASQISGRFQLYLKGMPQVSWRGIMNDDPNAGIELIPASDGVMSTPHDNVFRNDARTHDTEIAGVEPWLNEVLKQKAAAPLLYDLSELMSDELAIDDPQAIQEIEDHELQSNDIKESGYAAFEARTMPHSTLVTAVMPGDDENTKGAQNCQDTSREQNKIMITSQDFRVKPEGETSKHETATKTRISFTATANELSTTHQKHHEVPPLERCGLSRDAMCAAGLEPAVIDRIYRSLFVYSVGFHDIISEIYNHAHARSSEAQKNREKLTAALWLLFMHLLEHCDEKQHSQMLAHVQQLYHGKLKRYADEISMVLDATKDDTYELKKLRIKRAEQEEALLMAREDAALQIEGLIRRFKIELNDRKKDIHDLHDIIMAKENLFQEGQREKAELKDELSKQISQLEIQKGKLGDKCRRLELEIGRSQHFRENALRKLDQYQTAKEWADDSLLERKKKLTAALAEIRKLSLQLAEEVQKGQRLSELIEQTEEARRDAEEKARHTRSAEESLARKVEKLQLENFHLKQQTIVLSNDLMDEGKDAESKTAAQEHVKIVGYGSGIDKYGNPVITEDMLTQAREKIRAFSGNLTRELTVLRKDLAQCVLDRDSNTALAFLWQDVATKARASEEMITFDLTSKIEKLELDLKREREGRKKDVSDLEKRLAMEETKYHAKEVEAERLYSQVNELTTEIRRFAEETANHRLEMDTLSKQLQETDMQVKMLEENLRSEKVTVEELQKTLEIARDDLAQRDREIMKLNTEDRKNKQDILDLEKQLNVQKAQHRADVEHLTEERDDAIKMLTEISSHNCKNRTRPDSRAGSRPGSRAGSRPTSKSGQRTPARTSTPSAQVIVSHQQQSQSASVSDPTRPDTNYTHRDVDLGFLARAEDVSLRNGWDISRPIILPPFAENESGAIPPFNLDSKSDAYHRSAEAFEDQINIDRAKVDTSKGAAHRVSHLETKALVHKLHREMEGAELALHDYCIGFDLMAMRYQNALEEIASKQAVIDGLEDKIIENKKKARQQIVQLKSKLATAKGLNQKVLDNAKTLHQRDVRNEYDLQKEVAKLKRDLKSSMRTISVSKERLEMTQQDYTFKLQDKATRIDRVVAEREALRTTLADEAAKNLAITSRLAANIAEIANLEEKVEYLRGEVQDRDRMVDHLRDHIKQQEFQFEDLKVLVHEQTKVTDAGTQYPHTMHASRAMQSDLSWVKGVLHSYTRGESSKDFFAFEEHKVDFVGWELSEYTSQNGGPEVTSNKPEEDDEEIEPPEEAFQSDTTVSFFQDATEDAMDFKIKYRVSNKSIQMKDNTSQDSGDMTTASRFQNDDESSLESIPFRAKRGSFSTKGTTVSEQTENE